MRKTKIAVTLGPASWSEDDIASFMKMGVDAFRLNFSHGTYEEKLKIIKTIRAFEDKLNIHIPVIGDLQGATLRIGKLNQLNVRKGDEVTLKYGEKGENYIPVPNNRFFENVEEGDVIMLESGRIMLMVKNVDEDKVKASALNDGVILSEKTIALKNKEIPLPSLSRKDLNDTDFILENDFDYIGLSFARSSLDVQNLKDKIATHGGNVKVITKIETKGAVEDLDKIIDLSDAILVARGDLAIYYGLEKIPRLQRIIIKRARSYGKPVMVATQLLESMISSPIPTRSEVVDIMTAVKESVDCLLLADETATGQYPITCVKWLNKIIVEAEKKKPINVEMRNETIYDKFAKGVVSLADSLNAKIAAYTRSGATARRLSRYRPNSGLYAFTPNKKIERQLRIVWGVKPYQIEQSRTEESFDKMISFLKEKEEISYGETLILTGGMKAGSTDIIRIEKI